MLVLAGVLAWHYADAERRTIEAQRVDVANNLGHLIDRDIEGMAGFLSGIALSPRLQAGDPEIMRRAVSLARQRGFEALGLFDRDGKLLVSMPEGGAAVRQLPMSSASAPWSAASHCSCRTSSRRSRRQARPVLHLGAGAARRRSGRGAERRRQRAASAEIVRRGGYARKLARRHRRPPGHDPGAQPRIRRR